MGSRGLDPASDSPQPPRKAARTRLRLVEAVRQEIEGEGSFSAESVARRADSSPATFYNHFSSKEEAVLAAFDAAMSDLVAFVGDRLDVSRALELGLRDFLREWSWAAIEFFRANSLVFGAARVYVPSSEAFRELYRAREAEALELYTRFIHLAQRAALVRAADSQALAEVLLLMTEGWNHPRLLRSKRGDALHEELARSAHAMLAPIGGARAEEGAAS